MLAELLDAVVGVDTHRDTHRDTHQVEIALPNSAPIASTTIRNDATGYAELLAWIVDHAPGPRLAISIEGTRSYRVGLARATAAAGLVVLECAAPPQDPPRARQVRPHRRAPGRADGAAPGRRPAAHPARRRRPRGVTHPARWRQELTTTKYRADKPAPRAATGRGRHRPHPGPRRAHRDPPGRAGPAPTTARGQPRA